MTETRHRMQIRPEGDSLLTSLREVWTFRELVLFLVYRDFIVRYKQSLLGIAWTVLQPVTMMIIFTLVFSVLAGVHSGGVPYPLYVYCALLPWSLFSGALTRAGTSLVGNAHLVTKVYFPRLIVPISAGLFPLVDFAVNLLLLLAMMAYFRVTPSLALLALPLFVLVALALSLGLSLWLTAVHVRYRDISVLIPLVLQVMMYACPIAYPASLVPSHWQSLYMLNPLVPVIAGFRWSLLGLGPLPVHHLWLSGLVAGVILLTGLAYFQRVEGGFADEI